MISIEPGEETYRCQGCGRKIKKGTPGLKVKRETPSKSRGSHEIVQRVESILRTESQGSYEIVQRVRKILTADDLAPYLTDEFSYCLDCLNDFGKKWRKLKKRMAFEQIRRKKRKHHKGRYIGIKKDVIAFSLKREEERLKRKRAMSNGGPKIDESLLGKIVNK